MWKKARVKPHRTSTVILWAECFIVVPISKLIFPCYLFRSNEIADTSRSVETFGTVPHPALRATFSRREKDSPESCPSPQGEGDPKGRMRDDPLVHRRAASRRR